MDCRPAIASHSESSSLRSHSLARLALASQEIMTKFLPQELAFGSTKELGPEFNNKTLAEAYAEGEAIGEKLLKPDIAPYRRSIDASLNDNFRFE